MAREPKKLDQLFHDTLKLISRMSATYQQGLLTLQRKRTGGAAGRRALCGDPL